MAAAGRPGAFASSAFRACASKSSGRTDASAAHDWARYPDPDAQALGVANLALHGVQGRGVLIDLEKHLGRRRIAVGYEQLMRILEADHIEVQAGDMVCLHTGFAELLLGMNRHSVPVTAIEFSADGRVLVRASGTEPLLRIMVEAADAERATAVVERLRAVAEAELGLPGEP